VERTNGRSGRSRPSREYKKKIAVHRMIRVPEQGPETAARGAVGGRPAGEKEKVLPINGGGAVQELQGIAPPSINHEDPSPLKYTGALSWKKKKTRARPWKKNRPSIQQ